MLPELLYYKFDEGAGSTTANHASPGVGSNPAAVIGHTLDASGVFGSTALNGNGDTGRVATGWATSLTGDWSIAYWFSRDGASSFLSYVLGDSTAGSFRAFNNGIAGPTGMVLRGNGMTDVLITGLSTNTANHIAFVHDSVAGNIKGYLNGALNTTVSQGVLSFTGTGFNVGSMGGGSAMQDGQLLDEFQLYSRALSSTDVVAAMNADFGTTAVPEPSSLLLLGAGAAGLLGWRSGRAWRFGRAAHAAEPR